MSRPKWTHICREREGGGERESKGQGMSVDFFLFLFASRKTKVSDREFDSRGRHSACETVIAVHMVK